MARNRGAAGVAPPPSIGNVLTYGRQCLDEADKQAVLDVLDGDWLTQGPAVERFEAALQDYFGAKCAVTCSSGTAALHLAAMSLGWKPGDFVIVPAITFVATANCCAYVGAEPYFVDIDDATLTIDPNEVERHIKMLRAAGQRVRAVIGVDMAGHACDWVALRELADRYDLTLMDDACHAMGATYAGGVKIGAGAHADVTVVSFHPVKHITTAEGGALLTNDASLAAQAARLRSHGIVREPAAVPEWEGPWHYDMVELGYNYRLSDLQCALGQSQLRKLDHFVDRRRALAAQYGAGFAGSKLVRVPSEAPGVRHAFHLYVARLPFDRGADSRVDVFARCREQGIQLQVHYRPVMSNSYYRQRESNQDVLHRFPVACRYYSEAISLPMFPQLTDADVTRVVGVIEGALQRRAFP
jgi:perosamine synthetase